MTPQPDIRREPSPQLLRLSGLDEESIVDGPGIRYTLFVQGCPHHCPGCHNLHTHTFTGGYERHVDDIFARIQANPLINGVTFSGGEPLCQAEALTHLARRIKETKLEITIYTGYTIEELLAENDRSRLRLLSLCDILIDGRYEESKRDLALRFRGSSNQRILDLKQSVQTRSAVSTNHPGWQAQGRH